MIARRSCTRQGTHSSDLYEPRAFWRVAAGSQRGGGGKLQQIRWERCLVGTLEQASGTLEPMTRKGKSKSVNGIDVLTI